MKPPIQSLVSRTLPARRAFALAPLALILLASCSGPGTDTPSNAGLPLRFGLLADVQYADKDTAGKRRYRDGLLNLEHCIDDFNSRDLDFVVHCGDIIDGRATAAETSADLERVLAVFSKSQAPVRHVIGNHCLEVPRDELLARLNLTRGYSSFVRANWRFILVDSLAFSTCGLPKEDPVALAAQRWLDQNAGPNHPNAQSWNGGLGDSQRAWLKSELSAAADAGEHAVIFSHLPVFVEASTPHHLLWDHEEVLIILDNSPAFTAWINGHDHTGGYAERNQRSFLTLPGMVEADPQSNAYALVEVHADRLEVHGTGNIESRTILAPTAAVGAH